MVKKFICLISISILCGMFLGGCGKEEIQSTQQEAEAVSAKSLENGSEEGSTSDVAEKSEEDDYAARLAAAKAQKPDGILTQAELDAIRNGGTLEDAAKYEAESGTGTSDEISAGFEEKSDNTDHYGEYDENYVKYIDDCNEMCVFQYGKDIISLVDTEKGDLPVYFYNNEGHFIGEGITDSLYGDSFIINRNGQAEIVSISDNGDGTANVITIDQNGQIISDTTQECSNGCYELSRNYQTDLVDYCSEKVVSSIVGPGVSYYHGDVLDNGNVKLINGTDGVRITKEGNEIAFFENHYPEVTAVGSQSYSLEGCLYGDFIVLNEYSGSDFGDMNIYLYLIK